MYKSKIQNEELINSPIQRLFQSDTINSNIDKKILVLYASGAMAGQQDLQNDILKIRKGALKEHLIKNSYCCDIDFTQVNGNDEWLITPISAYGRRVYYKVEEVDFIQNSRQMKVSDAYQLAQLIISNYEQYQSFIIVSGLATLTYLASMLSFMLENLQKTILVTGCMIPITFTRNDAFSNLFNSIILAGHFSIPEVLIVFGNKAFRGNRCRHISADSFDGIDSPNFPALVSFGIDINIKWDLVMRRDSNQVIMLSPPFSSEIIVFKVTPFTQFEHLRHLLDTPGLRCCIFECYHFAEMPHSDSVLELLKDSQEKKEILVVMLQQCIVTKSENNLVKQNFKEGLIVRYDITPESAVAKMGYLLGKEYPFKQIRQLFQQNFQGEIESADIEPVFERRNLHFLATLTEKLKKNTGDNEILRNIDFVKRYIIPNLGCHMAKMGQIEMIKELRKFNSNLSYGDYDDRTMLHISVAENHLDVVKYLISICKVDINAYDWRGFTPMAEALFNRNKEMLFYLQQNKGYIKAPLENLTDNFLIASCNGDLQFFQLAFYSGIKDLNQFINIDKRNSGHLAVWENQLEIVRFLKHEAHFDFNQKDIWGNTPLDEAILLKRDQIVQIIQNP